MAILPHLFRVLALPPQSASLGAPASCPPFEQGLYGRRFELLETRNETILWTSFDIRLPCRFPLIHLANKNAQTKDHLLEPTNKMRLKYHTLVRYVYGAILAPGMVHGAVKLLNTRQSAYPSLSNTCVAVFNQNVACDSSLKLAGAGDRVTGVHRFFGTEDLETL